MGEALQHFPILAAGDDLIGGPVCTLLQRLAATHTRRGAYFARHSSPRRQPNQMADSSFLPPNLPPRLLDRRASAAYVGLSATKFDELVCDGRMPKPKKIDRRRAWDIRALDSAIDALPGGEDAEQNPFDD